MTSDNKEAVLREATRLAELSLTSQVQLMLAADQRATTFAGIMIATVAVVSQGNINNSQKWSDDLGLIILGVSAALAAYSARSVRIHAIGNEFINFSEDLAKNRPIALVLRDLGKIYDDCSAQNRSTIRRNSRVFNGSLLLGISGFFVSVWSSIVSIFWGMQAAFVALAGGN